jgi:hypothetical protein
MHFLDPALQFSHDSFWFRLRSNSSSPRRQRSAAEQRDLA